MKKIIQIEKKSEICEALYEFEDIFPHLKEKVLSFENYSEKLSKYALVYLAYENGGNGILSDSNFLNTNNIKWEGCQNKERYCRPESSKFFFENAKSRKEPAPFGILIMYANDKENKTAYISLIGVKREFFGKGCGAYLMEQAEGIAKAEGMSKMMLEVDNDNIRAQKFYEKCGFSRGGEKSGTSFHMIKGLLKY